MKEASSADRAHTHTHTLLASILRDTINQHLCTTNPAPHDRSENTVAANGTTTFILLVALAVSQEYGSNWHAPN